MVRDSPIRNKALLESAIKNADSKKEVLAHLGLRAAGGNYSALSIACEQFGLKLPEYVRVVPITIPLSNEEVFVEESTYINRRSIKKRLYALGVKEECASCHIGNEWNGKPLTLTLEHKNGVWNDNRIENLEILCPNCHSQTATFAGRTSHPRRGFVCIELCGSRTKRKTKICADCTVKNRKRKTKIEYPSLSDLVAMVNSTSYSAVGRSLGVSDNAIRKHIAKERLAEANSA